MMQLEWSSRLRRIKAVAQAVPAMVLLLCGCATNRGTGDESGGDIYLATTNGCQCAVYSWTDPRHKVRFDVSAKYAIDGEFVTRVDLEIRNEGNETLKFTDGYFQIASRNVPFRYNKKMLPLSGTSMAPGEHQTFNLSGSAKPAAPNLWYLIAGEELTVTVTGIRAGSQTVDPLVVTFVPKNPKLRGPA